MFVIALLVWPALHVRRVDVILGAIAFSAAYCLLAFGLMARSGIFIPGTSCANIPAQKNMLNSNPNIFFILI